MLRQVRYQDADEDYAGGRRPLASLVPVPVPAPWRETSETYIETVRFRYPGVRSFSHRSWSSKTSIAACMVRGDGGAAVGERSYQRSGGSRVRWWVVVKGALPV